MPRFYTVDRQGSLQEGQILNLKRYSDISPSELQSHVDDLFPDGVSSHGEHYFLRAGSSALLAEPNVEILFEYVRRARYSDLPSRFQSIFAFKTVDDARFFRRQYGKQSDPIWELDASDPFIADMRLLTAGSSILVYSHLANKYWSGEAGDNPLWEALLIPPVKVIRSLK